MAIKNTGWVWANDVHQQKNVNLKGYEEWSNESNAVGNNEKVFATSKFTKTKYIKEYKTSKDKNGKTVKTPIYDYKYTKPYTVTARDFRLGEKIPKGSYITDVYYGAWYKSSKGSVAKPRGGIFIKDSKTTGVKEAESGKTGWHSGIYYIYKSSKNLIGKTVEGCAYDVTEDIWIEGKYTLDQLFSSYHGIDLYFDKQFDGNQTIYLQRVGVKVSYEPVNYKLYFDASSSETSPDKITSGTLYTRKLTFKNESRANGGTHQLKLDIPYGVEVESITASTGTSYNANTKIWTVNANANKSSTLTIKFRDYTINTDKITVTDITENLNAKLGEVIPTANYWFITQFGTVDGYGQVNIDLDSIPHQQHTSCLLFTTLRGISHDSTLTYRVTMNNPYTFINWSVDYSRTSTGVDEDSKGDSWITFTVPPDREFEIAFQMCFQPHQKGSYTATITSDDDHIPHNKQFNVADPYEYHFGKRTVNTDTIFNSLFIEDTILFYNHRIASELETGAYLLPCTVKESDSIMNQGKPNIHMYKWEQIDYIGCVPVEHHHFDPKSTYKDKLLDTTYKNKRYMGKELASDEDIDLNIRLHPHQVTTVQGLIDMDKPIPINANHRCFEGDALNHRGWAEIYGIKAEETNPSWYKCSIDVKYLTHNLNTRFNIKKGNKSFSLTELPQLLTDSFESGSALSEDNSKDDYFEVDTDGGYIYNEEEIDTEYYTDDEDKIVIYVVSNSNEESDLPTEMEVNVRRRFDADDITIRYVEDEVEFDDALQTIVDEGVTLVYAELGDPIIIDTTEYGNEHQRNIFTLDEGQHMTITSREVLSDVAQVTLDWSTSLINEYKENAVSKIIRLVDKQTNITMFEYEYYDFDIDSYDPTSSQIECSVIGRVYNKGDYDVVLNKDITLPLLAVDDDEDIEDEDNDSELMYGSEISFMLNNHKLSIIDNGYSGKAVDIQDIELQGNEYYYQVNWQNNNTDGETGDILVYIGLNVLDSLLASKYGAEYSNMYVSPVPIRDKEIIFTREAEEGTIYYLRENNSEFSFLLEPYYQYHNGVDLRSSEGTSLFNLNYGYKTVYLQNGLVGLGIDRLNGHMYLQKYDPTAKDYITLFNLQLQKYDDVNINSISDDKIELQASDILISMYRGHPYVIFKHNTEDIDIISKFGRVWAENVGDNASEYPAYYDLLNTENLLPPCFGGVKTLDPDCLTIWECENDCPDLIDVSIEMNVPYPIYEDDDILLNVSSENLEAGDKVHYFIDGEEMGTAVYPNSFLYAFPESKEYEVSAVYEGNDTKSYAVADTVVVFARQVEAEPSPSPTPTPPIEGKWKLTQNTPSKFKFNDGQEIIYTLTKGGVAMPNKVVEMTDFKVTNTATTNKDGQVKTKNNHISTKPNSYNIGAKYYEGGVLITKSKYTKVKVSKARTEFQVVGELPSKTCDVAKFKLVNKENGKPITDKKVTVRIDGVDHSKKTNSNGNVAWKIKSIGNHTYKCSYSGNDYYEKCSKKFSKKITKKGSGC